MDRITIVDYNSWFKLKCQFTMDLNLGCKLKSLKEHQFFFRLELRFILFLGIDKDFVPKWYVKY